MKNILSIKIEKSLLEQTKEFCRAHGLKQGFFVEKALRSQLDKETLMEDIIELKELRSQEKDASLFNAYLEKRKS
ncbi:MAG: hypothetical protein HQL26_00020 [Candidatus Omnitrophica bacterium]|nr:hypothetical protein [Candidatus Omnitrophota bacterium]